MLAGVRLDDMLADMRRALDQALSDAARARRLRTLGGVPPPITATWDNAVLGPPLSAHDSGSPPLNRGLVPHRGP